jgi:hypothetical protein
MSSRLHPDDITAIATQVAALLSGSAVNTEANGLTVSRLRNSAQTDLAAARLRKAQRRGAA